MKKLFLLFMICVSTLINAQEKETDNFKKTDEFLSEVVKKALLVAEKTGNFVIEQSPLILQEFYNWNIAKFSLGIFLCLVGFILSVIWFVKFNKHEDLMDEFGCLIGLIFSSVIGLFSIIYLCINIYNLVFILVAPKLYLIEYFIK